MGSPKSSRKSRNDRGFFGRNTDALWAFVAIVVVWILLGIVYAITNDRGCDSHSFWDKHYGTHEWGMSYFGILSLWWTTGFLMVGGFVFSIFWNQSRYKTRINRCGGLCGINWDTTLVTVLIFLSLYIVKPLLEFYGKSPLLVFLVTLAVFAVGAFLCAHFKRLERGSIFTLPFLIVILISLLYQMIIAILAYDNGSSGNMIKLHFD
jgi:hypothetical protein